jgi:hypothetical protein
MSAQEYFKIVHAAICTLSLQVERTQERTLKSPCCHSMSSASLPILTSDLIDSGLFIDIRQVSIMSMSFRKTKEGRKIGVGTVLVTVACKYLEVSERDRPSLVANAQCIVSI